MAWGDEPTIAKRVREHLDAGANHVLLQPLGDLNEALRQLESPGARSTKKTDPLNESRPPAQSS